MMTIVTVETGLMNPAPQLVLNRASIAPWVTSLFPAPGSMMVSVIAVMEVTSTEMFTGWTDLTDTDKKPSNNIFHPAPTHVQNSDILQIETKPN